MAQGQVQQILAALKGAFVAADLHGRITSANGAAERLLGWSPGDLVGRAIEEMVPDRMKQAHRGGFEHFRQTGESRLVGRPVRVPAVGADGRERDVDLTVLAYQDPQGDIAIVAGLREPGNGGHELLVLEDMMASSNYRPLIGPQTDR